jgi:hypothetical protein
MISGVRNWPSERPARADNSSLFRIGVKSKK